VIQTSFPENFRWEN